jgi:DNA-binding response OmpR family regulator
MGVGVAAVSETLGGPLVIGVANSAAERAELTRLVGGGDALLLVSSAEQARAFLGLVATAAEPEQPGEPVEPVEPTGLSLDSERGVLRWMDRELPLTRLEHDFLRCLVSEPGQVWTHQRLHLAVWGNDHLGRGSDIHSVVKRLRRKLARLEATVGIHAVRGVGFRL